MAGIPNVKVILGNGNLGQSKQTTDGVFGMVCTGAIVGGGVAFDTVYTFFKLQDAVDLGIDAVQNALAYEHVKAFYDEVGDGSELWFMVVDETTTMDEIVDLNNDYARKLIVAANGRISLLAISTIVADTPTIVNGLDATVHLAVPKAQALAEQQAEKKRPFRVVLDGKSFNGTTAELYDYKQDTSNRVAILIASANAAGQASVGQLLGRKSSTPVMRNIARVIDGPLENITQAYFTNGAIIEDHEAEWDTMHDKGYIIMRNHTGRTGYYFADDPMCTTDADDYSSMVRGLVIDKVSRITNDIMTTHLVEEVPVSEDGTIAPVITRYWEQEIENAINLQMTANGEVSGVDATIALDQDILTTDELEVTVEILPVAYAKKITIYNKFTLQISA